MTGPWVDCIFVQHLTPTAAVGTTSKPARKEISMLNLAYYPPPKAATRTVVTPSITDAPVTLHADEYLLGYTYRGQAMIGAPFSLLVKRLCGSHGERVGLVAGKINLWVPSESVYDHLGARLRATGSLLGRVHTPRADGEVAPAELAVVPVGQSVPRGWRELDLYDVGNMAFELSGC